jgi:hypothetical protein
VRRLLLAAIAALVAQAAAAQAIEISSSEGYAESLVPSVGWRQAVVGRQLPEGSIVATWAAAKAEMGYLGAKVSLGPLSRLEIASVGADSVGLRLTEGSLGIAASGLRFEIDYRGARISIQGGEIVLADGSIEVVSGIASVEGYALGIVAVPAGTSLNLLLKKTGPVFGD